MSTGRKSKSVWAENGRERTKLWRCKRELHKGQKVLLSLQMRIWVAAFECLGYAEFYSWVGEAGGECCTSIWAMGSNFALVLSYCLWTQIYVFWRGFFSLSLTLLELAEKNKWYNESTIFSNFFMKQWMQVVCMCTQTDMLGLLEVFPWLLTVLL